MGYEIHEYIEGTIRITKARTTFLLLVLCLLIAKGTRYSVYWVEKGQLYHLYDYQK